MTTFRTNFELDLLNRGKISDLQSFEKSLMFTSAPSLMEELNSETSLSYPTLLKTVAHLADHSNASLELILKEKLAKTDSLQTIELVKSVCEFSLLQDRLKMLEVCKRIISLNQLKSGLNIEDAMAIAERESSITPAPTRTIEVISDTAIQNWHQYSGIFGKIIHWIQTMIVGTFTSIGDAILSPVNNPPTSFMAMQGFCNNYRSIINGFVYLTTSYLALFTSYKTAALAGTVIFTSVIAINHIHKRFRLGIPEQIDKNGIFKNTSSEAQNGQIKRIKDRRTEREQVKTAWNVFPGEKFRIALLVGPSGCGKTEFVRGLAYESVDDPNSFVFGKKIFTVNTNELIKTGTHQLSQALANIAGHEDDIILFFDEGHNAGGQQGAIGSFLETLKTTLLDKNIRTMIATTENEFKTAIEHNTPFVDRCKKVTFGALPDSETKKILKDNVGLDVDRMVEVNPNAYDALLKVAATIPERSNPRKAIDLHKDVRSFAYSWQPKKLSQNLDQLITDTDDLETQCKTDNNHPNWSNSPEGKDSLNKLANKKIEILTATQALKTQELDLSRIARLRNLGPDYRKQYNKVVHQVVAEQSEELQKEFLYLKHILRPALEDTLENEARKFTKAYEEEIPLKIDAALIEKLYPAAFSGPKDSSIAPNSPKSEKDPQKTVSIQDIVSAGEGKQGKASLKQRLFRGRAIAKGDLPKTIHRSNKARTSHPAKKWSYIKGIVKTSSTGI